MDTILQLIPSFLLIVVIYLLLQNRRPQPAGKSSSRRIILDSCALIDGRVAEVVQSNFIPDELIVPQFIVAELQLLADGRDSHKRERARFGLDMVKALQESSQCTVVIDRSDVGGGPTDERLVRLSKKLDALLYTTDFNLQKVAEIDGVRVLNVNELAQNLRPVALPGELKQVKIVQKGSNPHQGVGYLEDGTMVVVQDAARLMNKKVNVEITRNLQTVAGKMLFGTIRTATDNLAVNPALNQATSNAANASRQNDNQPAAAPARANARRERPAKRLVASAR